MGKVLSTGPLFEGLLKDAGFINIHIHTYKLPIGTWPKDKKMVRPTYESLGELLRLTSGKERGRHYQHIAVP